MTDREQRDQDTRVAARGRGRATVRRATIAVAVSAAAVIGGVTGVLVTTVADATTTPTSKMTTSKTQSTTTQHSDDGWGSAISPDRAGGQPSHTATSGS